MAATAAASKHDVFVATGIIAKRHSFQLLGPFPLPTRTRNSCEFLVAVGSGHLSLVDSLALLVRFRRQEAPCSAAYIAMRRLNMLCHNRLHTYLR